MTGRILVVDDLSINRTILRVKLTAACYTCIMAATGQEAIALALSEKPDLVLLDYHLPDEDGIEVCRALRACAITQEIPILLFSATAERQDRLRALQAGADDFLSKPLDESFLMGRIRSLLRSRHAMGGDGDARGFSVDFALAEASAAFRPEPLIGIICGCSQDCEWQKSRMDGAFPGVRRDCMTLSQALRLDAGDTIPDLFLIAPDIISAHGLQVISDLRSRAVGPEADLCVLLQEGQELLGAMALDLGAREVLRLPLDPEETQLRLSAMLEQKYRRDMRRSAMESQLRQALHDPLTGLFNRRHLLQELTRLSFRLDAGEEKRIAVLLIDLDYFKEVNDYMGHTVGDDVLAEIARRLRMVMRETDIVARYGGDEFVALMPDTDIGAARKIAARICKTVTQTPLAAGGNEDVLLRLSASVGIAIHDGPVNAPHGAFVRELIGRADAALRSAKASGRNKMVIAEAIVA